MITNFIYWSLVGWCGTPWPRRWPFPNPNPPDPEPWWRGPLLGLAGGIAGGWLASQGMGMESMVASSFGALAGGRILSDVGANLLFKR